MVEFNKEETKRANALTPDEDVKVSASAPEFEPKMAMGDNTGKTPTQVEEERKEENKEKKDGESVE